MEWFSFIVGALAGITCSHIFIIFFRGFDNIVMTPSDISNTCSELNKFGCWVLYLFIALISPVVYIFKFIYIITHVGRIRY